MKKFASLLLTAVLLATMLCVFAVPASAAEAFTSGDYKYTVSDDGTATITEYTGNGGNIEIPADFDGHTVTEIGEGAFEDCEQLTAVTIPGSVKSIGGYAFANCSSIETLTIPGSVKSIGDYAFADCGITTLTISDGVKSIGAYAFVCAQITSVTIPGSVDSIGESAFDGCGSITTLTISDGVESIGERAFFDCANITNVTIPDSVKSIGNDAFTNCGSGSEFVIHGINGSAAEEYAIKHDVLFQGEGKKCKHLYRFSCEDCNTSMTKKELLALWKNTGISTGSVLSEGSLTIILCVACLAVGLVGGLLLGRKKKKPAVASGENKDEE